MTRRILLLFSLFSIIASTGFSQVFHGRQAQELISGAETVWVKDGESKPSYVKLGESNFFDRNSLMVWLGKNYGFSDEYGLKPGSVYDDKSGGIHYRYKMTFNGFEIHDGMIVAHETEGRIYAINGSFRPDLKPGNGISLSEAAALQIALNHVNAQRYKWQMQEEEALLKVMLDDPNATYFPKGEVVLMPQTGLPGQQTHLHAWKFTIYADQPLYKKDVFVDAESGQIVVEMDRIHVGNSNGTAVTKYSGTRPITTDSVNPTLFRLRETERGQGIETYNLQNGSNYGSAVDFTDSDNFWNNVNAAKDEIATDAHWGAEMTYDYYFHRYGRNSIDDNGFKLRSYVHYNTNYANAFWDGTRMTYGDGNGSMLPLTALDICAHEITHGLTTFTADLDYQYESGAMNEGYSDIFAAAVEFYAKPGQANWLVGENIGVTLRSMSNPNAYGDPDTYMGTNYYVGPNDNGGVHTNSGVLNFWFYLTTVGGTGTNDHNNQYNVSGIGIDQAGAVAYRTLSVYLVNSSQYADARYYSIQSATDLYGPCSPQVASVTNAMYAVGIGPAYIPGVIADFSADITEFCAPPATVKFKNLSNNANSFYWDFGNGMTSTQMDPTHTYQGFGSYNVKLVASGGTCGTDSVLMNSLISIDPNNPCVVIMPLSGSSNNTGCSGKLFDTGGTGNYQNNVNSTITIAPNGASTITLTFLSFDFEAGYDYLKIYNGPNASSPLIGSYDGTNLPNGGTIVVNGSAVTLVQTSDQGVTGTGFEMDWICSYPTAPPVVSFLLSDTSSCSGTIQFQDNSTNGPTSWNWDFGDGNSSTQQHPVHTYTADGYYNVTLIASNSFGTDTVEMPNAVHITLPSVPVVADQSICNGGIFTFTASSNQPVRWYDQYPGGSVIDTGYTLTTPFLTSTKYYYCESIIEKQARYTGKTNNSGGGAYFTAANVHYLVFDALQPFKLASVKVYAQTAGNRTISLRNSSGAVMASKTVNIPAGEQRITLDLDVPAGTNLQLAGPGSPNLYRNSGGLSYPYQISNVVSIKFSSASTDPTGYYYFFYDWEIKEQPCTSPVTTVMAHVANAAPTASFSMQNADPTITFTNTSALGATSFWDFGDGQYSTVNHPAHTYAANGAYTVKLVSGNGCGSDSTTQNVSIVATGMDEPLAGTLLIYPNPSRGVFSIEGDFSNTTLSGIQVLDLAGRIVYSEAVETIGGPYRKTIDLSGLGKGAYLIRLQTDAGAVNRRVVIY